MKRMMAVAAGLALVAASSHATLGLIWGVGSVGPGDPRIYDSDGTTLLTPTSLTQNLGCFVQLIKAAGGVIHDPVLTGDGTGLSGGDALLAKSWIGDGGVFVPTAGFFSQTSNFDGVTPPLAQNDWVYFRVWNNVSPDWDNGYRPTTGSGGGGALWGDSELYQISGDPGGNPPPEEFYITQDVVLVPEPATLALFGLGLATMLVRRRRQA